MIMIKKRYFGTDELIKHYWQLSNLNAMLSIYTYIADES